MTPEQFTQLKVLSLQAAGPSAELDRVKEIYDWLVEDGAKVEIEKYKRMEAQQAAIDAANAAQIVEEDPPF